MGDRCEVSDPLGDDSPEWYGVSLLMFQVDGFDGTKRPAFREVRSSGHQLRFT
ncbi:MAG: hypothetical protein WAN74_07500 [Thermoplasmata archaeon]